MFNLFRKIVDLFSDLQQKFLMKKFGKNASAIKKAQVGAVGSSATLEIKSQKEKKKEKVESNLSTILKKYENDPEKLLAFVQRSGTNVYRFRFADKILRIIRLEEGFISEVKGLKAIYLNFIISILAKGKFKFDLKTKPMFILKKETDFCIIVQQFYKWYSMKANLPGFDAESQENLQKFLAPGSDGKIKDLSVDEILNLKEAIARDVESIDFIVNMVKENEGAKQALKKMGDGGASI